VGVDFQLNGVAVTVRDDHPHLLAALREELDVTSPKDGCSPSGQCGCCTVLVDGKVQVSCQLPLAKAEGRTIITLEGLAAEERNRYAQAFAACGGLQCGFCIPGIVLAAKALLDEIPQPTDEELKVHMDGNLCRCTGYEKIEVALHKVIAAGGAK
jgi:aerobic-type carbon monoxide dehydrogenase small subunit (CoxS/CutS family)